MPQNDRASSDEEPTQERSPISTRKAVAAFDALQIYRIFAIVISHPPILRTLLYVQKQIWGKKTFIQI